jgi:hypothetical protein
MLPRWNSSAALEFGCIDPCASRYFGRKAPRRAVASRMSADRVSKTARSICGGNESIWLG